MTSHNQTLWDKFWIFSSFWSDSHHDQFLPFLHWYFIFMFDTSSALSALSYWGHPLTIQVSAWIHFLSSLRKTTLPVALDSFVKLGTYCQAYLKKINKSLGIADRLITRHLLQIRRELVNWQMLLKRTNVEVVNTKQWYSKWKMD